MKALLLSEYSVLEMVDLPMPRPGPGEVLVRVEACGICGSDVHGFDGTSGRRIPPLVMGHEAAGSIAALGVGVDDFREGQHVTFDSTVYCGECMYCKRGQVNLCDKRQVLGVSTPEYKRAGAFAEYVVVPVRVVHGIPDQLAATKAAMVEPLAVALHAVELSDAGPDSIALVVGAGMIGLLVVQALRAKGVRRILVSDIDDGRLKMATDLGATTVLNAKTTDVTAEVLKLTEGRGADVALEAVGSTATLKSAIDSVRKGATVVLIGNIAPNVEIPLQAVVSRQIRLQGSAASAGEYPRCIEMLANGQVEVDSLISVVAPLEEGAQWFDRLHAREANLMKVILTPNAKN